MRVNTKTKHLARKIEDLIDSKKSIKEISKELSSSRETIRKTIRLHLNVKEIRKKIVNNLVYKKGEENPRWKGGKEITKQGYVRVWISRKERLFEHRMVMQRYLGRKLKNSELIHHINGIKTDNRIENLQIIDPSSHTTLHNKDLKCLRNNKGQFIHVWK